MVTLWTISSIYLDIVMFIDTDHKNMLTKNNYDYFRVGFESFHRFYTLNVLFRYKRTKLIYLVSAVLAYGIMAFASDNVACGIFLFYTAIICAFLGFFEDGISKEQMMRYYRLRKQAKKNLNVLSNLTECVLILDAQGQIKFSNHFLKRTFLFEGTNGEKLGPDFYHGFGELNYREYSHEYRAKHSLSSIMLTNFRFKSKPSRKFTLSKKLTINGQVRESLVESIKAIKSFEDLVDLFIENSNAWNSEEDYFFIFDTKYEQKALNLSRAIEIRASVLTDGTSSQLLFLFRDTTERDKIAELKNDNMIYRNNILASFSHELRTPLNSSLGFLEQTLVVPEIPKRAKDKLIKPALVSNRLLLSLVNDILDFSQVLAGKLETKQYPADIRETIENCAELFWSKIRGKGVKLEINVCDDVPVPFYADHQRISQILINLLSNAVKYTNNGTIEINFERIDDITYDLCVVDTGTGMSHDDLGRLLLALAADELKNKLNQSSSGIGLGLFISNALAKRISGRNEGIKIMSEPEEGTKVYITLEHHEKLDFTMSSVLEGVEEFPTNGDDTSPTRIRDYKTKFNARKSSAKKTLSNTKSAALSSYSVAWSNMGNQREKLLIVDDEIFNIMILENFCREFRIPSERAFNGKEAIEKIVSLEEEGVRVRVILLDVNMPVMDGYETASTIKQMVEDGELQDVIIIGVTAYVSPDMIANCYRCGFTEVLNKPVSKDTIRGVLRNYKVLD